MKQRRHAPEQVIRKLAEDDKLLAEGKTIEEVARHLEVSERTWHRWRTQYGGMKADDAKRLKELEKENARLKKLYYRLDHGDSRGALSFQKSRHSTWAVVEFTINVGAPHLPTRQGYGGARWPPYATVGGILVAVASWCRAGNPRDEADLGHKEGAQYRADALGLLHLIG